MFSAVSGIPKFKRVCHYNTATIGCPAGLVLKIDKAFWGRVQKDLCHYVSVTNCGLQEISATTKKLQGMCDNAPSCKIHAIETVLGNQCSSVSKYLEINYTCIVGKDFLIVTT